MPFRPQGYNWHTALSKQQLLCSSATWQWHESAQSYLFYALWLIPMWYTDCIMKLDHENAQMLLWATLPVVGRTACCLNGPAMCFLCVGGGMRERKWDQQREPTGFNVPWHVLVRGGLHLLMQCVDRSAQRHFRMQATCVIPDVLLCVYYQWMRYTWKMGAYLKA